MGDLRPHVLFLVHRIPYPPNRGDRIRSFHMLEFLAERAQVDLAFPCLRGAPACDLEALRSRCRRMAAVPVGRASRWIRAAGSVAVGGTATVGLFASSRLRRVLRRWSRDTSYRAVLVFCSSTFQYLRVKGLDEVPAVADLVDVDSQKWLDYAATSGGWRRRLFELEGRRLRRLEKTIVGSARAVTLVSQAEAALLRSFCQGGEVHVLPNGVDLDYFQPGPPDERAAERGCVFIGALDYRANLDAVLWFCEQVWPAVRRQRPDARFAVVGSNPSPVLRRVAKLPGVDVVGEVDDVRLHVRQAAAVVVPLRVARGIQNKVLEAMALGKAVLASPQALEGLAVEPGRHALSAETPSEWAEALAGLLASRDRRAELGLAGRGYVETHHRWEHQLGALAGLMGLSDRPTMSADAARGEERHPAQAAAPVESHA